MIPIFRTKLGFMGLAFGEGGLLALTFGHPSPRAAHSSIERTLRLAIPDSVTLDLDSFSHDLAERLQVRLCRFAEGEPVDFEDFPVAMIGLTAFQARTVEACQAIPWGETVSYGDLANAIGHPGAARAVGSVMAKNRVPLIVPCHRVLGAGGNLGGYSAPQGLAMKRRLLAAEMAFRPAMVL